MLLNAAVKALLSKFVKAAKSGVATAGQAGQKAGYNLRRASAGDGLLSKLGRGGANALLGTSKLAEGATGGMAGLKGALGSMTTGEKIGAGAAGGLGLMAGASLFGGDDEMQSMGGGTPVGGTVEGSGATVSAFREAMVPKAKKKIASLIESGQSPQEALRQVESRVLMPLFEDEERLRSDMPEYGGDELGSFATALAEVLQSEASETEKLGALFELSQ